MSSRQLMNQCKTCKKMTMHVAPSTSHVLHLLMSIITVGLWLPVWFIVAASNQSQAQCTVCGKTKGLFG